MYSYLILLLVVTSHGLASAKAIDDDAINQSPEGGDAGLGEDEDFDALTYLEKAGYLDDLDDVKYRSHAPDNVKQALREFQEYSGLPKSGRLDKATVAQMKKPRCGVPDVVKPSQRPKDQQDAPLPYVAGRVKWYKNDLTYKFNSYTSKLSQSSQRSLIAAALKMWSDVTPLNFMRRTSGTVDMDIAVGSRSHGDSYPFDGPGGTLAHAFFPGYRAISGDLHFDADERWTERGNGGVSFESVAAHEFGHSLGLAHSNERNALMYAFYSGHKPQLHQDDINGIQSMYGRRRSMSNPTDIPKTDDEKCNLEFDAIEQIKTGPNTFPIYAFAGEYIYTVAEGGVTDPLLIQSVYKGAPSSPGAVVYDKNTEKAFFFKGTQYWRYTGFVLDQGYPKTLPTDFHHVTAATQAWFGDRSIYVFQGDKYAEWNEKFTSYTTGYPKIVKTRWLSSPSNPDAIFHASSGYEYMFKGQQYWRFFRHTNYDVRSPGYPKSMGPYWLGCGTIPANGHERLFG